MTPNVLTQNIFPFSSGSNPKWFNGCHPIGRRIELYSNFQFSSTLSEISENPQNLSHSSRLSRGNPQFTKQRDGLEKEKIHVHKRSTVICYMLWEVESNNRVINFMLQRSELETYGRTYTSSLWLWVIFTLNLWILQRLQHLMTVGKCRLKRKH